MLMNQGLPYPVLPKLGMVNIRSINSSLPAQNWVRMEREEKRPKVDEFVDQEIFFFHISSSGLSPLHMFSYLILRAPLRDDCPHISDEASDTQRD